MRSSRIALMVLVFAALCVPRATSAAPILFEGQTLRLTYEFPFLGSVIALDDVVVGAGVEVPNHSIDNQAYDFSDTNIFVDYRNSGTWTLTAFNGFHVFDLNGTIPAIVSVTINPATNLAGFTASRITFDADNIWVDWGGLSFDGETVVSLDVLPEGATPVPEPAQLLLLGAGLAAVAARVRRRRGQHHRGTH